MKSLLGSLNYYRRFMDNYAIFVSVLYELKEVDFHEWRQKCKDGHHSVTTGEVEEKWSRVQVAFALLKKKITAAPILRHSDPSKEAVINVYLSEWVISASLVQDNEGLITPVTFTSRTPKPTSLTTIPWRKRC
uniref:Reverse transcriptase/retrotransposon-derived protein RNase H-like domain-containing protein n=1 Tax=Peronospora matthiolae TaxID=2874970 RepID=A0AAV1TUR7_9STRA